MAGWQQAIFCQLFSSKCRKITKFHRRADLSLSFAQPSTGVPQTFCDSFIRPQQSWARIEQQTCGKAQFLGCISTIDDYYGCPRFTGSRHAEAFTGERAMKSRFWSSIQRLVTVALFAATCGALLYAQSTTDGAIGGTVYDTNGAVVANAKITVRNNGTNAESTITTDGSGFFRVNKLQPGAYTVSVSQQGFAPYKAEQVIVQVGSVTDLSPRLAIGSSTETVEVTAEAPQINSSTPEFAPTLDQVAISNLPINGGRWSSFAVLTPGVVANSSGFGLLSFRGISTLLNNNTVDGADNNQAFFSEERGRTRAGYSTPKTAIEEFQVNTSNYSAEYGRSAGGVVNTVTKSGTNRIHGEGYFYDRDNDWGAINPFTTLTTGSAATGFTTSPYKPTDWRKIAGFGAGGAIVKDKLFWFVTYDWYHRNFPGTAVFTNAPVNLADPTTANLGTLATRLFGANNAATQAQA